jgi:hypothetical protein
MEIKTVVWRDSNMYLTQCSKDDDFDIETITSIGFVVKETDALICLAGDALGNDVRRVICIPKENIVK